MKFGDFYNEMKEAFIKISNDISNNDFVTIENYFTFGD